MTSNYMNELFNPSVSTNDTQETQSATAGVFNPNANGTPDKKYSAIIRFVPWWEDPGRSILQKASSWLTNDVTQESRYVDSPSTVGDRCPIMDMFFTLWRSPHDADKEVAKKKFSVRTRYYSIVQVIEDKVKPENNGKLLVWRYGMTIHNKINEEMNGEFVKINPFNVMEGRYFHVNVKVEGGYNNYNSCGFVDIPNLPKELPFFNENGEIVGKADPNNAEALLNYLKTGPSLREFEFKPWDDSTREFVDGVIRAFNDPINYAKTLNQQYAQPQQPSMQQAPQQDNYQFHGVSMQDNAQPTGNQADFLNNLTNNISEANNTSTGSGSEDIDGLNFDDILNNQIF